MSPSRVGPGVLLACGIALLSGLLPGTAEAQSGSGSGLKITIAARVCDQYTDIFGNLARNNIMESLKDLGPDTPYGAGEAIKPAKEDLSPQSRCKPLPGWRFTLGTSYQSLAVSGPWGNLSIVTNPFSAPAIVTKASTPLLNNAGQTTGQSIEGATTIQLTNAEADQAGSGSGLWIQGGTPQDPVLNQQYPGQYGFGALRCAIDNYNGDNVETVRFPQGARHVFCYAYYVNPPPTSGTIIVRKQIDAPDGTSATNFPFKGNISFNSDGSFALNAGLNAPASITFYRAEVTGSTPEWSFAEQVPQGWTLTDISCVSQNGSSTTTTNLAAASTSVRLGSSDIVTCTYTDRLTPPAAGLLVGKITEGGVGTFRFDVAAAGGATQRLSATTQTEDVEARATSSPLVLAPGAYTIREQIPTDPGGRWRLRQARCNGRILASFTSVSVSLSNGQGVFCTFYNQFTPNGAIRLRKRTVGGVGTAVFVIRPVGRPGIGYQQAATTTRQNTAVLATGDDTSAIRLGSYSVQESTPNHAAGGYWTVDSVTCNGVPVGTGQGRGVITLTAAVPVSDCTVTDRFNKGAVPPAPTPTPGSGGGGASVAVRPSADLVLVKRARPKMARSGRTVRYLVTLTNRGPDAAQNVTIAEVGPPTHRLLTVTPSQGTCRRARPVVCKIGTVRKGQIVRLRTTAPARTVGTQRNTAAVNTSTHDPVLRNNTARATIRVISGPRFTG